jgi:hypothetical protein
MKRESMNNLGDIVCKNPFYYPGDATRGEIFMIPEYDISVEILTKQYIVRHYTFLNLTYS